MNSMNVIGRLVDNPELSYTAGGTPVTHFDLAVPKNTKDKDAPPNYFPVTCWNHTAEFAAKYLTKGRRIAISGRLDTSKWTDKFDQNRKDVFIVADNIEPLDSGRGGANEEGQ